MAPATMPHVPTDPDAADPPSVDDVMSWLAEPGSWADDKENLMARSRSRQVPQDTEGQKAHRTEAEAPDKATVERVATTLIDPNDPAALDEAALLDSRVGLDEAMPEIDPASMDGEGARPGSDIDGLDDVGDMADVGPALDDLGIDPAVGDPAGLGEPGMVLDGSSSGSYHPADDIIGSFNSGMPDDATAEEMTGTVFRVDYDQDEATIVTPSSGTSSNPALNYIIDRVVGEVDEESGEPGNAPAEPAAPSGGGDSEPSGGSDSAPPPDTSGGGDSAPEREPSGGSDSAPEREPSGGSDGGGTNAYSVEPDFGDVGRTDAQQEYLDMKIDAMRGSEVNPEGTEETFSSDVGQYDVDDISGADDPTDIPEVETPAHLDGMVHDEGVIDPVE